ncbi:MAG: response regulator [Arcobacteraceae bacterium]|nr:response regulator [Arcobacteraceae bacterium]
MGSDYERLNLLAKAKKVLLVDDDEMILDIFKKVLSKYFKLIKTAKDGSEAWEMYRKEHFDLVISDIEMPNTNGIMLAKGIRARDPEQAILISSAYTEERYLVELLNIGVDGFLKKPVNLENLFSTILRVLTSVQIKQDRQRVKFKKYANEILKRDKVITKSNYQKEVEKVEEEKVKLNVKVFMEKIKEEDPESYHFFETQKEAIMEALNELSDDYEMVVYKHYEDSESLENLIKHVSKLYSTFLHFDNLKIEAVELERLATILETIELDNTNEQQMEAFDILEFLIEDIKRFVIDMFFEENVEDINYFRDSLKENITLFENILNEVVEEDEDDDSLDFF